jgi:predicted nucleic acid-binding protein
LCPALLSHAGNEALIILAVNQGLLTPCLSEEIIADYANVLARPKCAFPPREIDALITMLRREGELFELYVLVPARGWPGQARP